MLLRECRGLSVKEKNELYYNIIISMGECQWGIALVSKQLKKSQLVSKLLKRGF